MTRYAAPVSAICDAPGCCAAAYCESCLRRAVECLSGVAAARGMRWAESVARQRPDLLPRPWPNDEKAWEIARTKVGDHSDPRLTERLVQHVMEQAAWTWERLAGRKG